MRNKYLLAALSVLLLVAVVATGIHVLNKEAKAEQLHRIKVWDQNDEGVEGIYCIIWVLDHVDGEFLCWNFYDGTTDVNGCFDAEDNPPAEATFWKAWVDVGDLADAFLQPAPGQLTFESVEYQQDGTLWICHCEVFED